MRITGDMAASGEAASSVATTGLLAAEPTTSGQAISRWGACGTARTMAISDMTASGGTASIRATSDITANSTAVGSIAVGEALAASSVTSIGMAAVGGAAHKLPLDFFPTDRIDGTPKKPPEKIVLK